MISNIIITNILIFHGMERLFYFLLYLQFLPDLNKNEYKSLKIKALKYVFIDQNLYWKDPAWIFLKCLDRSEVDAVTAELHGGAYWGHKYWKATTFKILRVGYYWPTCFTYLYFQVKSCIEFHKFAGKDKSQSLPLKPIVVNAPFHQ